METVNVFLFCRYYNEVQHQAISKLSYFIDMLNRVIYADEANNCIDNVNVPYDLRRIYLCDENNGYVRKQ